MAFGSMLAYLYARGVTGPLKRLSHAASAIANGNLEHIVQAESRDEIGMLARAFEEMRVRVRAMLQAQQQWNVELEDKVHVKTAELEKLVESRDQLLRRTITAQEDERRRVARELHDETSQALTALIANLAVAQTMPGAPAAMCAHLGALKKAAVETLQEVNRIVLDLRPTLLDDYGLIAALSWYAENRLDANETSVRLETFGAAVRLPPTVETILFRVGQEAITNIAKYARAKQVWINVLFENGVIPPRITLQIQDDGVGFDAQQMLQHPPKQRPSFGLLGMYERVSLVGGQIDVRSEPGKGTTICATVPLDARAGEDAAE
jgi:signal transduction histidine kinase